MFILAKVCCQRSGFQGPHLRSLRFLSDPILSHLRCTIERQGSRVDTLSIVWEYTLLLYKRQTTTRASHRTGGKPRQGRQATARAANHHRGGKPPHGRATAQVAYHRTGGKPPHRRQTTTWATNLRIGVAVCYASHGLAVCYVTYFSV